MLGVVFNILESTESWNLYGSLTCHTGKKMSCCGLRGVPWGSARICTGPKLSSREGHVMLVD